MSLIPRLLFHYKLSDCTISIITIDTIITIIAVIAFDNTFTV